MRSPAYFWRVWELTAAREIKSVGKGWMWRISLPFFAVLQWCKKAVVRDWRGLSGSVWPVVSRSRDDQLEVAQLTKIGPTLHIDFCSERIEFKDFIKILRIGDRIRVLCDDGVLVVEKISQQQFKVVDCQTMAELIQ
jgi:hypothetical protein